MKSQHWICWSALLLWDVVPLDSLTLVSTLALQREDGAIALFQPSAKCFVRVRAACSYSSLLRLQCIHSWQHFSDASMKSIKCDIWRNQMWADESWSQQTAFPCSELVLLTSLHSSVSRRAFISIHIHAHSVLLRGYWRRRRVPRYQSSSPCLLITALDYWCWWRGSDMSQVTQTPHKHLSMFCYTWGNWQA